MIDETALKAALAVHKDETGYFAAGKVRRMLEAYESARAGGEQRGEAAAVEALKKINIMLGNAIGAGAIRRGDMMSQADSRFFWVFDITKEALSPPDNKQEG